MGADGRDEIEFQALDLSCDSPAHAVIADRDDDAGHVEFGGQGGEVVGGAVYGEAVNAPPVDFLVVVVPLYLLVVVYEEIKLRKKV